MALLSVQTIEKDSIDFNFVSASSQDTVKNTTNYDVILLVKNDSDVDITVTIPATCPCDQSHYHDEVVTVKAHSDSKPIPLHSRITSYTNFIVTINYSATENVKVCAYRQIR